MAGFHSRKTDDKRRGASFSGEVDSQCPASQLLEKLQTCEGEFRNPALQEMALFLNTPVQQAHKERQARFCFTDAFHMQWLLILTLRDEGPVVTIMSKQEYENVRWQDTRGTVHSGSTHEAESSLSPHVSVQQQMLIDLRVASRELRLITSTETIRITQGKRGLELRAEKTR